MTDSDSLPKTSEEILKYLDEHQRKDTDSRGNSFPPEKGERFVYHTEKDLSKLDPENEESESKEPLEINIDISRESKNYFEVGELKRKYHLKNNLEHKIYTLNLQKEKKKEQKIKEAISTATFEVNSEFYFIKEFEYLLKKLDCQIFMIEDSEREKSRKENV